jgi:hypothetical protein
MIVAVLDVMPSTKIGVSMIVAFAIPGAQAPMRNILSVSVNPPSYEPGATKIHTDAPADNCSVRKALMYPTALDTVRKGAVTDPRHVGSSEPVGDTYTSKRIVVVPVT